MHIDNMLNIESLFLFVTVQQTERGQPNKHRQETQRNETEY